MKLSKFASAASFAHLLGLATAKAEDDEDQKEKSKRAEEVDDDKQREDESDEDYAKRMEEKDDKEKSKRAEEVDSDEEDEDDKGDAKKAKRAEGDSDDDGESAKAERARCAKIIAHGIANGCVRQAGVFAFDTNMTATQAIRALEASAVDGKARSTGLRERMAGVKVPNVGTNGGAQALDPTDPKAKAMAIVAAGKKRRGEV